MGAQMADRSALMAGSWLAARAAATEGSRNGSGAAANSQTALVLPRDRLGRWASHSWSLPSSVLSVSVSSLLSREAAGDKQGQDTRSGKGHPRPPADLHTDRPGSDGVAKLHALLTTLCTPAGSAARECDSSWLGTDVCFASKELL